MTSLVRVDEDGALEVFRNRFRDFRPLLGRIANLLVREARGAFRSQGRGNDRWPERMVPNIPGIIGDLNRGASPPDRRFRGRPALIDTGALSRSYRSRLETSRVVIFSTAAYAKVQEEGGDTQHKLTDVGRENLVKLLRQQPDQRENLGWLFSQPEVTVSVQPRPVNVVTDEDIEEINELVREHLEAR